jgi:hypothetical protein
MFLGQRFLGKVAVVIGGNSGIGLASARALVARLLHRVGALKGIPTGSVYSASKAGGAASF